MPRTLSEQARSLKRRRVTRAGLPALLLLTDPVRLADPRPLLARLPRGSAVILREGEDGRRARLAEELAPLCRRRRLLLLVAGDAALAQRVGAAGVHWPQRQVPSGRRRRHPRFSLVTAAAHDAAALHRAARAGADAALLSPVFPTRSHPGAAPLGVLRFAAMAQRSPLPVYALGGVSLATVARLRGSSSVGLAAIDAFGS